MLIVGDFTQTQPGKHSVLWSAITSSHILILSTLMYWRMCALWTSITMGLLICSTPIYTLSMFSSIEVVKDGRGAIVSPVNITLMSFLTFPLQTSAYAWPI